jgi:3-oxoacyl-[acyl-carrier protein] reductase
MSATARNALVTGGTKGIGKAVVRRFLSEGHRVTAVYRQDENARQQCAQELAAAGLEATFERVDVTDPAAVSTLFAQLVKSSRDPDFLINAAGMTRDAPLAFLGVADFDEVLAANLRSTFLTCQQGIKGMVRRRFGRIVNFASPAALLGNEGQVAYAAAKAGVLGLTRSLAREVGRFGITVNAVSPGLVLTGMTSQLSEERRGELLRRIPLKRVGTAEEIAGMVSMLCHDNAAYVTGQCLSIDGGLT